MPGRQECFPLPACISLKTMDFTDFKTMFQALELSLLVEHFFSRSKGWVWSPAPKKGTFLSIFSSLLGQFITYGITTNDDDDNFKFYYRILCFSRPLSIDYLSKLPFPYIKCLVIIYFAHFVCIEMKSTQ